MSFFPTINSINRIAMVTTSSFTQYHTTERRNHNWIFSRKSEIKNDFRVANGFCCVESQVFTTTLRCIFDFKRLFFGCCCVDDTRLHVNKNTTIDTLMRKVFRICIKTLWMLKSPRIKTFSRQIPFFCHWFWCRNERSKINSHQLLNELKSI